MKRTRIFTVCLFVLMAVGAFAADKGSKAGLSTNVTEFYQLRNKKFGDLLRPEGASAAVGTRIVLYPAQPWKCMTWELQPAGKTDFYVQNHLTAKTFNVKAADSERSVVQVAMASEAGERPLWRFTRQADGSYRISVAKTGAALTAVAGKDGTVHMVITPWEYKAEQRWELEKIDPARLTM